MIDACAQLAIWGWSVTSPPTKPGVEPVRAAFRSSALAYLCEKHDQDLDGWWDRGLIWLWTIEIHENGETVKTPARMALAGYR